MQYDLIVLGGGPGGYLAAERAGGAGLKVLLIEERNVGGVCLNEGCIPTKTLLHSAKLFDHCKDGKKYGVTCENPVLDHASVMARKDKVVRKLVAGVSSALKKNQVEVKRARGTIAGSSPDGLLVTADGETHTGKSLIIATGSQPVLPPIPGLREALDGGFAVTSRELLSLKELPGSLVIIGGGVIGLEMAAYFAMAGSKVNVVELLPKIAGEMDAEISALLRKSLEGKGITFHLGAKAAAFGDGFVTVEQNAETTEIPCDKVLLSVGRKASAADIGLETLGVATDRGNIAVDDRCLTNIPNVYAVGDCNGKSMLAHTAYRQAEVAVNTILGREDHMCYSAVPSVVYTSPEVASVGLSHEAARKVRLETADISLSMNFAGRYVAENERGEGICKLVFDKNRRTLIGAHIIGGPASEFILSCGILIETELPLERMKKFIFPHPTVCEILREGMFQVEL